MREGSLAGEVGIGQRAAQYIRMSTEEQDYSTFNQSAAIAAYAAANNMQVVRSYSDDARSGLNLDRRPALKSLLDEVQTGKAAFDVILVYDVSRWGRFQDADESAYYEYLCKKSGVPVVYCAEDFKNDGSLVSTLIKALQRAEAADYSRRLSLKVFAGQCTLSKRGFWQGAQAGYGLRRVLVDANGAHRAILSDGERKYIQSDRVILGIGPANEVELVRRMFKSFANDGKSEIQIAKELNEEGYINQFGRPWNRNTISKILSNEKYIGNNVFNRTSSKLKIKSSKNPPEQWIRSVNAFEGIVDPLLFRAAQERFAELTLRKSDQRMLENLSSLLGAKGYLNSKLINGTECMPKTQSYKSRFGSLLRAYELIGYRIKKFGNAPAKRLTALKRRSILPDIIAEIQRNNISMRFDFAARNYLLNNASTVQIYMLKCQNARHEKWILRQRRASATDFVICVRMKKDTHDFALLRSVLLTNRVRGTGEDIEHLGARHFQNLSDLTRELAAAIQES